MQWDSQNINAETGTPLVFIIYIAANGALIAIMAFLYLFFTMKRYYPKPGLYVAKFFVEIPSSVGIIPVLTYAGYYLKRSITTGESRNILQLVLFMLNFLILVAVFWLHSGLSCFSCYISRSRIHGLGEDPLTIYLTYIGMTSFLQNVFAAFQAWLSIVLVAISALMFAYWYYTNLRAFFIHNWVMQLFFGGFATSALNSIFQIINYFASFPEFVPFIVLYAIWISAQITTFFYFRIIGLLMVKNFLILLFVNFWNNLKIKMKIMLFRKMRSLIILIHLIFHIILAIWSGLLKSD